MENNIIEEIRKIDPNSIVEKTIDERIEEIKIKYGVKTIEEMEELVRKSTKDK